MEGGVEKSFASCTKALWGKEQDPLEGMRREEGSVVTTERKRYRVYERFLKRRILHVF